MKEWEVSIGNRLKSDFLFEKLALKLLGLLFSVILSIFVGDISLGILQIIFCASLDIFFPSLLIPGCSISRFIIFSCRHGVEGCLLYLSFVIPCFLQSVFSQKKTTLRGLVPGAVFLIIFILFFETVPSCFVALSCSLPSPMIDLINFITRVYIFTYVSVEALLFRYRSRKSEKLLKAEAMKLRIMEEKELRFLQRFSHLAKTEMNGIINFMQFLRTNHAFKKNKSMFSHLLLTPKRGPVSAEMDGLIDTILMSCQEISHQTVDLVNFFRVRRGTDLSGSGEKSLEVCNITRLLNYVIRVQKKLRIESDEEKKKNVKVELFQDKKSVPKYLTINVPGVSKILMNIVSNAIKYTDRGYVHIYVEVIPSKNPNHPELLERFKSNPKDLMITVVDSGVGVEKEMLSHLFEPFVRSDTGKDSFSIGLVITKNLVKRLNGRIQILSEGRNKGTTVVIAIPLANKTPKKKDLFSKIEEEGPRNNQDNVEENSKGVKKSGSKGQDEKALEGISDVLIVEDNLISRRVFEKQVNEILGPLNPNLNVHLASDGEEGLRKMEELIDKDPLILTDLDMPNLDGVEFCGQVRSKYENDYSPLIVACVTATYVPEEKRFCEEYAFDKFISKPVRMSKMKETLIEMSNLRKRKQNEFVRLRNKKKRKVRRIKRHEKKGKTRIVPKKLFDCWFWSQQGQDERNLEKEVKEGSISVMELQTFIIDLFLTCVSFVVIVGELYSCPEVVKDGHFSFVKFYTALAIIQFFSLFFLTSVLRTKWANRVKKANQHFSMVRLCISLVWYIYQNEAVLRYEKVPLLVCVSFSLQSCHCFPRFLDSLIFSGLFYAICVGTEIWYFLDERFWTNILDKPTPTYDHQQFLTLVRWSVLGWFIFHLLLCSSRIVSQILQRRKKWQDIIDKQKNIKDDNNVATSKISHDLATPSSALITYLDDLRGFLVKIFESSEDTKEYFSNIILCSLSLELSIQNFLIGCKIKNNMVVSRIIRKGVNVQNLVESKISQFLMVLEGENNAMSKRPQIRVQFDQSLRRKKFSFDVKIVQLVLTNILMNAFIHSEARHIQVSVKSDKEEILVVVEDDGKGISKKVLEKNREIVKHFHFEERFSTSLGLGIPVCYFLSRLIDGTISFQSKVDSGTKVLFSFRFHQEFDEKSTLPKTTFQNQMEQSIPTQISSSKIRKRKWSSKKDIRVLCVDDSIIILNFMKMYLRKLGFLQAQFSTHEEKAIEVLSDSSQRNIDLFICDYSLRKMKFDDLLKQVKESKRPRRNIIVTGDPELIQQMCREDEFFKKYVHDIVAKPISMSSLQYSLEQVLNI